MIPLNEQAYQHLRHLITTSQFSYQEIYSETKLSKELGISRTPFRDAVHRLAQEGYIDIIPSKGFMLHQLTRKDVDETFQVRSALEAYCAMQIAMNHTGQDTLRLFRELDLSMAKQKEILDSTQSIQDFSHYDFQFHRKIIDYLNNEQFSTIFATFMYRMQRLAALSLAHEGRMSNTYHEHLAILDAMKAGDTAHIYEVTLRHMETPREINLEDL